MKYPLKLVSISIALSFLFSALALAGGVVFRPNYDSALRPDFIPEEAVDLTGEKWEFAIGDEPGREPKKNRQTNFPHTINFGYAPEADLSGINYEALRPAGSKDIMWYRKSVTLPHSWKGAILTLEGVDYEAEIFVNGQYALTHKGAYAPFEVNLSPFMHLGVSTPEGVSHVITMRVQDDRLARDRAVGKQERRPYEGVIFYGNSSGAWKGAFLRKINPAHYISTFTHRTTDEGSFSYQLVVDGDRALGDLEVQVSIYDRPTGLKLSSNRSRFTSGTKATYSELVVDKIRPWSPADPQLYNVEIELLHQNEVVEKIKSYTGFRTFAQNDGHFFLNQTPFYLRGVLNQMVFPKGLYTPEGPTDNAQDMLMIKNHGFNFQRVHQTTPRWRDIYDMEKLGVAWTLEMPSARDLRDAEAFAQFQKEWKEIIRAYGHGHPGLLYYIPMNEDWGFLEDDDHWAPTSDAIRERAQLALLRTTLEAAPPGALVSPGDGWRQVTGIKNGLRIPGLDPKQIVLSAHDYRGSKDDLVAAYGSYLVNAPPGTTLPRNGKELIMSGFNFPGKDVAPVMGEMGGKSFAPPGIGNVFGYGRVYRDLGEWTKDALSQFGAMAELKIMRGGYVYTQLRDAGFKPHRPLPPNKPAGELNGFLFADGKPKSDPALWFEVNRSNQAAHEKNRTLYESLEGPLEKP